MTTKGIILAGGAGSRLYPITQVASKQLQPIYDKPMIYYPLSTLMLAGIRDILLISTPHDLPRFRELLGTGEAWGISLSYKVQERPDGISQAFLLGEDFLDGDGAMLVLGDNIFYGKMQLDIVLQRFSGGAFVYGYAVRDPERYGVLEFSRDGNVLGIEEKPKHPKSHYVIPGLYLFDSRVAEFAKQLKPSPRGELEITDLIRVYLDLGELDVSRIGRGIAWLDTGTPRSMLEASLFIQAIEDRQGLKISCPEEIAWRRNFITADQLRALVGSLPNSSYRDYLAGLVRDEIDSNLP